MKKTFPLFIILILLLIGGAWIMIENTPTNEQDESKVVIAEKNLDSQAIVEQVEVEEDDEDERTKEKEINIVDEKREVLETNPIRLEQGDLVFKQLDLISYESPFATMPIGKTVLANNREYLVIQEIKNPKNDLLFRLLTTNTAENQEIFSELHEWSSCFNGDTALSSESDKYPAYLALYEGNKLIELTKTPLNELGYAANGCITAWRWFDNKLLFTKHANGADEIWKYNPINNEITMIASYSRWSTSGLGDPGTIQHVWTTQSGTYVQNQTEEGRFGDIFVLANQEFSKYRRYHDEIETNKKAYETDGYFAWSDLFSEESLNNLNRGLTFTINDKKVFLPW